MYEFLMCAVFLADCASTFVVPISKNEFILKASAAPVCGSTCVAKVAAIETIKVGYDGSVIVGAQSGDNVRVVQTAPAGAYTSSSCDAYGNSLYGNSTTTFTGGGPIVPGRYSQDLAVRIFRKGEPGFANATDAKNLPGAEWQEKVSSGVTTCG